MNIRCAFWKVNLPINYDNCALSSAANTWDFALRSCEYRFYCIAIWRLPGTSPTNDWEGDRTKGDTQDHTAQSCTGGVRTQSMLQNWWTSENQNNHSQHILVHTDYPVRSPNLQIHTFLWTWIYRSSLEGSLVHALDYHHYPERHYHWHSYWFLAAADDAARR